MKRKINPIPPDDPSYPFDDYDPNREWDEEERRLILMIAGLKKCWCCKAWVGRDHNYCMFCGSDLKKPLFSKIAYRIKKKVKYR